MAKARDIRKAVRTKGYDIYLYAPMFEKYCKVAASEIIRMLQGASPNDETNAGIDVDHNEKVVFIDFQI